MNTLTLSQAAKIKNDVMQKFNVYIHFHDACPKQYFSLDQTPDSALADNLKKYFEEQNFKIIFSSGNQIFHLEESKNA